MIKLKQRLNDSPGQALVEFALIISVLLAMIFLIIESARILWAWNTVQNAAREGARYAITGQAEAPDCAVDFGLPKFVDGGRNVCNDLRLASVIERTHTKLAGLPLNEESVFFEDDEYYNIEVWGVNQQGQLQYDFAGVPSHPVVVRVTYRVPIITPVFSAILPSIPVFGQETLNNETFGQLGGSGNEGAALPPNLPPLPTPGVTPSPTPSPTPSNTPTPGPTSTPTFTPTFTPTPRCDIQFEGGAVAGNNFVLVTGDVGISVTIINLSTGATLGSGVLGGPFNGHACDGFGAIILNPALTSANIGQVLMAVQTNDSSNNDTTIVVGTPPTATPSPTLTPVPTNTPTNTPLPTPTHTPSGPYIVIAPDCGPGPNIQFILQGYNWPTNQSVTLMWQGAPQVVLQANTHPGNFTYTWSFSGLTNGTYTVSAVSGSNGATSSDTFTIPCAGQPTPTPPPQTATPVPADLLAFGPPKLVSTPPIVAYKPVQFTVAITNTGEVAVENQFFVDIYLDPTTILTDRIPLTESDGYSAVSGLAGGASRVITVTSPLGFTNNPTSHKVYGMVDSVRQIVEVSEVNNVTNPLTVLNVTPAATPTPTPNLTGNDEISGVVRALLGTFLRQFRATVVLINESTSQVVAVQSTDQNGYYQFDNVPPGNYTVQSCVVIDNIEYFGFRTGRTPPDPSADIFALQGACP
ncbi:MAG: pilus assembly protein [Anaerolineaceae bacterium]|nr:pilus assembly protein [Anaerolineaceae bacterium]